MKPKEKGIFFQIGDILEVHWVDAIMLDSDDKETKWVPSKKLKKHCNDILAIKSTGIAVHQGKNYLALTMSINKGMCGPHQLIPLTSIFDIKIIKKGKCKNGKRK